jgi:hypothetical protein
MPCTFSPLYGSSTPCSGYGTCINTTNIQYPQLCQCDWTAVAPNDVFDLRVDPANRNLAIDCNTPRLAIQILSAILLAFTLARLVYSIKVIHHRFRQGHAPKHWHQWFTVGTNRVVIIDIFCTVPLMACWPILRLSGDQIVGTDTAITIVMPLSILSMTLTYGDLQHQLFAAVIGTTFHKLENNSLLRLHGMLIYGISASYFFVAVIPTLITLSFDKNLPPQENGLLIVLIIRNIGLLIWQICALLAARMTSVQVHNLIKSLGEIHGVDTGAVLAFVKNDEKEIIKKNFVALIAYILFSTPWMWTYQGIQMLMMAILGSSGMIPGKIILGSLQAGATISLKSDVSTRNNNNNNNVVSNNKFGTITAMVSSSTVGGGGDVVDG